MSNTITLTDEQMAKFKATGEITIKAPKSVQWEPQGGDYFVRCGGDVAPAPSSGNCRKFGTERQTREQAELARDAMQTFNRLSAYRDEFDPNFNNKHTMTNWFIYYDDMVGKYRASYHVSKISIVEVYMSKQAAEDLAVKLNSGEVVL